MFDVIVVGGGPIGLNTANILETKGYRVLVLEEDKEIGKPLRCSGLISSNIRKFFPDIEYWGVIENRVEEAILHSKRSELVLRKKNAAYVIDRVRFDKKLSGFLKSGISFNTKATGVDFKKDHVEVSTGRGKFRAEMVIGCDGPGSTVGKFAGKNVTVKGLIGIVKTKSSMSNVDLYFDKGLLKDGFFWRIPRGEATEYGVWGSEVGFDDLERFFGMKNYEKFAGLIPVKPVRKTFSRRCLLIGDAAGQIKPWSGGGVIYGLACSKIACDIVEKAFRFNDFSEGFLKEYEKLWEDKIGKQLKFGQIFRKFLRSSSDFQLDVILKAGSFFNYGRLDMDFIL